MLAGDTFFLSHTLAHELDSQARSIHSALHIIDDMGRWGVTPDRLTFNIAMDVFAKAAAGNSSERGAAQARRKMAELFETIGTPGLYLHSSK